MSPMRDLEWNIARLEAASERAEEATRQARAVLKDIERVRRDIDSAFKQMAPDIDRRIAAIVTDKLDALVPHLEAQSKRIFDRVSQQVDVLINLALGKPGVLGGRHEDLRPALAKKLYLWLVELLDAEVKP